MKKGSSISIKVVLGLAILLLFLFPTAIAHSENVSMGFPFENEGLDIRNMFFVSQDEG